MKVRVLGCHGGVAPGYQTTCYSINDSFLVDAGSVCSSLTPEEQKDVTDILITHPHLDHIKDICFLLENTFSPDRTPVTLHAPEPILNDVHQHIFNDVIWPDFSKIHLDPERKKLFLKWSPIKQSKTLASIKIKPFPVNHPGHAVGYLLEDSLGQVIFTGDSGSCDQIWSIANKCSNLRGIFTEISFPNRMASLAQVSGHFTLEALLDDFESLKKPDVPIYISHFKPLFLRELLDEFHKLAPPSFHLMHEDDEISFS